MDRELIRVLIVDDHAVTREGLKHVISRQKDMIVAGEAPTLTEALKLLDEQRFDVVVCDVKLPDGYGWEVLHAGHRPVKFSDREKPLKAARKFAGLQKVGVLVHESGRVIEAE